MPLDNTFQTVSVPSSSFESHLASVLAKLHSNEPDPHDHDHVPVYLASVSGGADSTAMLSALASLRTQLHCTAPFSLSCIHVEHGIRPREESTADARAVVSLCAQLEVSCRVVSITPGKIKAFAAKVGTGIEAAARIFRRRALLRERDRIGARYVLTAHTEDDLLETLLMRILRGSGPSGLAPMPGEKGCMLKPLLDRSRRDVIAYLAEKGIPYQIDATNADIRFLRNRIRHKLIPLLDEFFPSWRTSILALAETQSLVAAFLTGETAKRLPLDVPYHNGKGEACLKFDEQSFFSSPAILREEAVFAAFDRLTDTNFQSYVPVPKRAVVRRAVQENAPCRADLGRVSFRREQGYVEIAKVKNARGERERGFSLVIGAGGAYTLKGSVFGFKGYTLELTARRMESGEHDEPHFFTADLPLVIRNHQKGDRLVTGGHKRRLSDILDKNARSAYQHVMSAEDAQGLAAFIGIKEGGTLLILCRECAALDDAASLFKVGLALSTGKA